MTQDTTITDELKACPCCGAPGYLLSIGTYKVKCTGCELQTKPSLYRSEAITAWNTRPKDTPTEQGEVARELSEAFELAHALIQEAKGLADGPNGGTVTDHLDFAENWLEKAERLASLSHPVSTNMQVAETKAIVAKVGAECERLFGLLDDIDTLDDACRADDTAFREQVRAIQRKRFDGGITTDGYTLDLSTITASSTTEGDGE